MSENPKCPYCGGEMKLSRGRDYPIIGRYWYRCDNCNALAPDANSPEEAYAAAMKRAECENVGKDYADVDQFICSECGIHLQDWVRIDEDDYEDGIVHEYAFRFCPNCGKKVREAVDDE